MIIAGIVLSFMHGVGLAKGCGVGTFGPGLKDRVSHMGLNTV